MRENVSLPEERQQINVKEKIELENHYFATIDSTKYYQWMHKIIRGKVKEELSISMLPKLYTPTEYFRSQVFRKKSSGFATLTQ